MATETKLVSQYKDLGNKNIAKYQVKKNLVEGPFDRKRKGAESLSEENHFLEKKNTSVFLFLFFCNCLKRKCNVGGDRVEDQKIDRKCVEGQFQKQKKYERKRQSERRVPVFADDKTSKRREREREREREKRANYPRIVENGTEFFSVVVVCLFLFVFFSK